MAEEIWRVEMVHGPDIVDVAEFASLHKALVWAGVKGTEYHPRGVDCLDMMYKVFSREPAAGLCYQYGTNYHWAVIEKIV